MGKLKYKECKNCSEWDHLGKCMNICGKPLDALEEFNEYKNLEEQGLLLRLPCKVGDTVYLIEDFMGKVIENTKPPAMLGRIV